MMPQSLLLISSKPIFSLTPFSQPTPLSSSSTHSLPYHCCPLLTFI
ncbi:hypothetical protein E2C01_088965 [Portunus trituberculatus]|uniref:Uncharacterized protein n=1 Tax=Portunus trituberculatus TaxID=210409 RepID=A0A5B7JAQ6_PORTR|nr:hypothetical protein [Portunus trituberculatus]